MPDYLALVACGAPLAARAHDVAAPGDAGRLAGPHRGDALRAELAGQRCGPVGHRFPALVDQRQPSQPKRFPEPAQVVVCPATVNSVNKLAAGIMDTTFSVGPTWAHFGGADAVDEVFASVERVTHWWP